MQATASDQAAMPPAALPTRAALDSAGLIWLALLLGAVLAMAFWLPIRGNDYWWYVRAGGEIARDGTIPTADGYTFTRAGTPFTLHSWLAALLFWLLHAAGGPTLTILARGVVLASTFTLVWQSCREGGAGPRLASAITLLAALASANNWAVRPQLLAYPLFALTLWLLWRWQAERAAPRWLLIGLMALWVNLHGSFVMGLLLIGATVVGARGRQREALLILGAALLATMLNPRGAGAWTYVLALLTDPPSQQLSAEWQPTVNEGLYGALFFAWLLLLPLLAHRSPARLTATQWLWFLGLGWAAVSGQRYVVWFLMVLAPLTTTLLVPLIGARLDQPPTRVRPTVNGALATGLLLVPLLLLPGVRQRWWPGSPPALDSATPVQATAWLAARPELPGQLWSEAGFASYLIYALPERPVWIDTRFELFPLAQWVQYGAIQEAEPGWEQLLAAADVRLLMIHPPTQPRLAAAVAQAPDWCLRYTDPTALIAVRQSVGIPCPAPEGAATREAAP